MDNVHATVGSLVVLAFLISLVLNVLAIMGRPVTWQQQVSFGAAFLLLVQVAIGFSLLGEGRENAGTHYLFAILTLLSLGFEHGVARSRETEPERARLGAIANGLTLALTLATYIIGQSYG